MCKVNRNTAMLMLSLGEGILNDFYFLLLSYLYLKFFKFYKVVAFYRKTNPVV